MFTLVYSLSALCKVSSSFSMLLLGRVLGGLGTSLLWTTWESWYIHRHCVSLGLPQDWLTSTFTSITLYNGLPHRCPYGSQVPPGPGSGPGLPGQLQHSR